MFVQFIFLCVEYLFIPVVGTVALFGAYQNIKEIYEIASSNDYDACDPVQKKEDI